MAQVINTNVASLFAQQALNKSAHNLGIAQQRLSSGLRINTGADDPTGLVTATGYDSTVRGANMAMRNANDGISTAQINDGIHAQVLENLQRIREIAVQLGGTASGTEFTQLAAENARLVGLANAASTNVVNDKDGGVYATVGVRATVGGGGGIAAITTDITAVTSARAGYGADISVLNSTVNNLGTQSVNTSAAYSRIMDTDYAVETTNMTRNTILQQAGSAILAQANQLPNNVLTLLK